MGGQQSADLLDAVAELGIGDGPAGRPQPWSPRGSIPGKPEERSGGTERGHLTQVLQAMTNEFAVAQTRELLHHSNKRRSSRWPKMLGHEGRELGGQVVVVAFQL